LLHGYGGTYTFLLIPATLWAQDLLIGLPTDGVPGPMMPVAGPKHLNGFGPVEVANSASAAAVTDGITAGKPSHR